jgi:hypothetical protein
MMAVYVDQLAKWPTTIRCFKAGRCHLTADTVEELHAFAARIGLRREWFQEHRLAPHYDLTPSKRKRALLAGAIFVEAKEQARRRVAARSEVRLDGVQPGAKGGA